MVLARFMVLAHVMLFTRVMAFPKVGLWRSPRWFTGLLDVGHTEYPKDEVKQA